MWWGSAAELAVVSAGSVRAPSARRLSAVRRSRAAYASAAEVGAIAAPAHPWRRSMACESLLFFLQVYFPHSTGLSAFSSDHIAFLARLESVICRGGREVDAVYRGFGKTTIGELSCLWALLTGRARFVVLLGADRAAAARSLESLKRELSENDLLLADWPEVCQPIRALDGRTQRCASQTVGGRRTGIVWTGGRIVLPAVPGSVAGGGCVLCKGFLSCNRGLVHKWDGQQLRPSFVFIDDVQSDDSARQPAQVRRRIDKLYKTVLMLGGHRAKSLAVFAAGTVVAPDDFMAELLDAELHPAWNGLRVPLLHARAAAESSEWLGEYRRLRQDFERGDAAGQAAAAAAATAYYVARRDIMDAGARVSWASCFGDGEVSAVQHAYNLLVDFGEAHFASECQQAPARDVGDVPALVPAECARRVHVEGVGVVPAAAESLTAFVDVQQRALYWLAAAWGPGGRCWVLDYGLWPDPGRDYVAYADVRRTLRRRFPGRGAEGAVAAGLAELVGVLLAREWVDAGGGVRRVRAVGVDAGAWQELVAGVCAAAGPAVVPTKGVGVGAADRPFAERRVEKGCRRGRGWLETRLKSGRGRLLQFDANYWKSAMRDGCVGDAEGDGVVTLPRCGGGRSHRLLADHLCAEYGTRVQSAERSCVVWRLAPGRDNHLLDCLVGAGVLGSWVGVLRPGQVSAAAPRRRSRRRVKYHG